MSPNYNLKLANLDPNATLEIPQNFQTNPQGSENLVYNLINPSLNVLNLCESEQSIKLKSNNLKTKKVSNKLKNQFKSIKRNKNSNTPRLKHKIQKDIPRKSDKKPGLNIMTNMYSDLGSYIDENQLTPSFFKKKKFTDIDKNNLLSKEPSYINNSQSQKITFGVLPKPYEKLDDIDSSVSIPIEKSSILFKEKMENEFNYTIIDESPLIRKKVISKKNMLYSSMAFPMSSSLDTSGNFSKILSKERTKLKEPEKEYHPKVISKVNKKNIIKQLKSKRKFQIQKLKEKTGSKLLKKQYKKVKKTSRNLSQKSKKLNMLFNAFSVKDSNPLNYSKNKESNNTLLKSEHKREEEDMGYANDIFEQRIISSMRNTADPTGLSNKKNDFIHRQLMSVQTSKIHSNMFENLLKENNKYSRDKHSNYMSFKQRMSSNVELDRKHFQLDDKGMGKNLNKSLLKHNEFPKEYGELKNKQMHPQLKKYSWRDESTSTLRKNTSLDLVLKKKSLKFMDMHKEILKNINKEVKNIYRLSSPSLKHFEDSVSKTDSITVPGRKFSKKNPVKKNSKKYNPDKQKKRFRKKDKVNYRVIGSLDFDDVKAKDVYKNERTTFEKSMKIFKGKGIVIFNKRQF
jgi:hypothetical protein